MPRPLFPARPTLALLTGLALAQPALAFDPANMSDPERDAFDGAVRAYLLENPEVLMEAFQVLEQRKADAQVAQDKSLIQSNADALFKDAASWVGGNPEGDVTLVEFMDYRCGYCRKAFAEVEELVRQDGNIRLIFKEFPILGEASVQSARFAMATLNVAGSDAYKAVHDSLIQLNGDPSETTLRDIAATLDLDADAIIAAMDSEEITETLEKNRELAATLGINGTPAFISGEQIIRGYMPLDAMQQLVATERDGA